MPDTTPLPLPECPREDCTRTVRHYHSIRSGVALSCAYDDDRECAVRHGTQDGVAYSRCYAPRTQPAPARPPVTAILDAILTAADDAKRAHDQMCDLAETLLPASQPPAVVLPTVDEVEKAWRAVIARGERIRDASQAVLDLMSARITPWKPVEPGTVIKAGTRYRCETVDGESTEGTYSLDLTTREDGWFIDPRTVPAEPEDPRIAVVEEWITDSDAGARDLLARLDAMGADQ